jgi:hypothetical protein
MLLLSHVLLPLLSWFVASGFLKCIATSSFLPSCLFSWIKLLQIFLTNSFFHFLDPKSTYTQIQHLNFFNND